MRLDWNEMVVYAAKMRDGTYRIIEAINYKDCKQFLGSSAVSIRKRVISRDMHYETFAAYDDNVQDTRRRIYDGEFSLRRDHES